MLITIETKRGDELANLVCEIDALIKDGTIPVGVTGISPNAAEMAGLFNKALTLLFKVKEVNIIDNPIEITTVC